MVFFVWVKRLANIHNFLMVYKTERGRISLIEILTRQSVLLNIEEFEVTYFS